MDKQRECIERGHCSPRHRSSKNRARWCRGKVGVEHDWKWVDQGDLANSMWRGPKATWGPALGYRYEIRVCATCQRQDWGRRNRCHCGELLVRQGDGLFSPSYCAACGYDPNQQSRRAWREGKVWKSEDIAWRPCRCEVK